VLLAQELEAEQCELIKDVCGYFTEDPNVNGRAEHLPRLTYEQALDMADARCELVHLGELGLPAPQDFVSLFEAWTTRHLPVFFRRWQRGRTAGCWRSKRERTIAPMSTDYVHP
jgi:hypothetical protein